MSNYSADILANSTNLTSSSPQQQQNDEALLQLSYTRRDFNADTLRFKTASIVFLAFFACGVVILFLVVLGVRAYLLTRVRISTVDTAYLVDATTSKNDDSGREEGVQGAECAEMCEICRYRQEEEDSCFPESTESMPSLNSHGYVPCSRRDTLSMLNLVTY